MAHMMMGSNSEPAISIHYPFNDVEHILFIS